MRKVQSSMAAAAMFLLIIAVLITSFQIAAYGDPQYRFYKGRYEKYEVTESLDMELSDVMEVTEHMMAFLTGEEEELSVITSVDGKEQDFFNEQDRLHMEDVKNLFLGGLALRAWMLSGAALLLCGAVLLNREEWKTLVFQSYSRALAVFLGAAAFLGAAFAVDFTACFTIFHEIFFTNDLWLFDPAEDYMIRMLPEGFFADMLLRIGWIFVGLLGILWVLLYLLKYGIRKPE